MDEEMARDKRVFIVGEDVGKFGGAMAVTGDLFNKYGHDRVLDTPISESAIIGTALGAAMTGLRPIAEIMFVDFVGVCLDQIVNQVAKVRYMLGGQVEAPLVIRTQGGAGKGYAAQHSQSLEAWFLHTPGIKVVMPATPYDAKGLLKSAIRENNPIMFIEHKILYNAKSEVPETEYLVPIGKADIKRSGEDVTIVTYSRMLEFTLDAAEKVAGGGIECEIIDLMTISPLDMETVIKSVRKTGRLITVEEGHLTGGVGAEIVSRVIKEAFDCLDAEPVRIAMADCPVPFNKNLELAVLPSPDKIAAEIMVVTNSKAGV